MLLSILILKQDFKLTDTVILTSFKRSACDIKTVGFKILNAFNWNITFSKCIQTRAISWIHLHL